MHRMWAWLRRAVGLQSPPVAYSKTPIGASAGGFWASVRGPGLAQGDFLRSCFLPVFGPGLGVGRETSSEVVILRADLIVVTQSCDLENAKAPFVALCPISSLAEFSRVNPKFAKPATREEVRKGRHEGLHMLASPANPENNQEALIVDFRQIYSLPFQYLSDHAAAQNERWRLQPPYLEHFSQSFARFFMRVGLPSSIAPFK